jgi:NADH:ubiquinone oxidoreductase subunit 6 (subunit J)
MTAMQIIFLISAALILISAMMVVLSGNMVRAALWLVSTLFGAAIIFALLEAPFIAVVQVVVYIGAIAILFIFAVMLTRRDMRDSGPQLNQRKWAAGLVAVLLFGLLVYILSSWSGFNAQVHQIGSIDTLKALGDALLGQYLLPFEVASVLLLAAMVGAVYVAANKK